MSDTTQQQAAGGMATIRYGVYNQPGPFAGKTVAEARAEAARLFDVPPDAQAYKGKEQLPDDYVIQPNDLIELHRRLGEKGSDR